MFLEGAEPELFKKFEFTDERVRSHLRPLGEDYTMRQHCSTTEGRDLPTLIYAYST